MTITDSRRAGRVPMPSLFAPAESDPRPAVPYSTTEPLTPGGTEHVAAPVPPSSRPARASSMPEEATPGGHQLRQAVTLAAPASLPPAGPTPRPANLGSMPKAAPPGGDQHVNGQGRGDTRGTAAVDRPGPAANVAPTPVRGSLLDPALALAADVLDDIERVRTANENRLRQMTRSVEDSDGLMRGFGYDESHPDVARLAAMVETLRKVEHDAVLQLQRQMRRHPLGAWVKATKGVGEKQAARLLASIGDPYINGATGLPRTVSALWAYAGLHVLAGDQRELDTHRERVAGNQLPADQCGSGARDDLVGGAQDGGDPGHVVLDTQNKHAGVAARRRKGERANWSTKAKTRAYLIAESCVKQLDPHCRTGQVPNATQSCDAGPAVRHNDGCGCSPYRVAYDQRRAHTTTTHPDWTDGHSHQDALRVASKQILKDLWRAARDAHNTEAGAA